MSGSVSGGGLGLLAARSLRRIGRFNRSVPVVVLVLAEQLEGLGGLGEDADGFRAAYVVGWYLPGERGRPNLSESVPQIQRVADQPGRRAVGHA
jgi:hypothetical protein